MRERTARQEYGKSFEELGDLEKKLVTVHVTEQIKTNRYDKGADTLTLTAGQVASLDEIRAFWETTFRDGETRYGFLPKTVPTEEERLQVSRFFFWTAWVASTLRPGTDHTYTNNWPADRTVGNVPMAGTYV